ncbi:hypothetical protein N0X72_12205 [Streptomyces carpaticus]|uniref:hypothetical protein n=1 Tax=Streptomyces carpaticus TaxID=285558 RepID=UPI00220D1C67|nr:hypothetical protein N0X72_12205 [Streptomyces carpaticus]
MTPTAPTDVRAELLMPFLLVQHDPMTAADPLSALKKAKRRFDRLQELLPDREARRNSLLTDAHADPLTNEEKTLREQRRARGEKNPRIPGRGRRPAIARLIGQTERNVRNLYETELARRHKAGQPRRLTDPDAAFSELHQAQRLVDEVATARDAYYEAIAEALPPHITGTRPTGPDADRFTEVKAITGLDPARLRRIQGAILGA